MTRDEAASSTGAHSQIEDGASLFRRIENHIQDICIPVKSFRDNTDTTGKEAAIPVAIRYVIQQMAWHLGERLLGETWNPMRDPLREHTTVALDALEVELRKYLLQSLVGVGQQIEGPWLRNVGPRRRVLAIFLLWWECWMLWDRSLAYRTLRVVKLAAQDVIRSLNNVSNSQQPDWEAAALRAACSAMGIICADTNVFKCVNLSRTDLLRDACRNSISDLRTIRRQIRRARGLVQVALNNHQALGEPDAETIHLVYSGLDYIDATCQLSRLFHDTLMGAADAVGAFDCWTVTAERTGSRRRALRSGRHESIADNCTPQRREDVVAELAMAQRAIEHAISRMEREKLPDFSIAVSRLEPWAAVLDQLRGLVESNMGLHGADDRAERAEVFVPRRTWIRYCYPFAVDPVPQNRTLQEVGEHFEKLHPWLKPHPDAIGAQVDQPFGALLEQYDLEQRLDQELRKLFKGGHGVTVAPLDLSSFWQGSGDHTSGGVRVELPTINIGAGAGEEAAQPHRAWIELNRMGHYCLCITPLDEITQPAPNELYRTIRVGTPFVFGEEVGVANRDLHEPAGERWDTLHLYAQDVIHACATALCQDNPPAFVRGHPHAIVIVQTEQPLGEQPEDVVKALDHSIGGRILLRTAHRTAATLAEWVRFPVGTPALGDVSIDATGAEVTVAPAERNRAMPLSEIGFQGDWCMQSGETSVFGIVASPSWLRDIYFEVAQFAIAWLPFLQMWHIRLQEAITEAGEKESPDYHTSTNLRHLEQLVSHHDAQLRADTLVYSRAGRRSLDFFLASTGVTRLEAELGRLLRTTERLADWYQSEQRRKEEVTRQTAEEARRKNDRRRDALLAVIAIFAVFDIAHFLTLYNEVGREAIIGEASKGFQQWAPKGSWEVLLNLILLVLTGLAFVVVLWRGRSRKKRHWRLRRRRTP